MGNTNNQNSNQGSNETPKRPARPSMGGEANNRGAVNHNGNTSTKRPARPNINGNNGGNGNTGNAAPKRPAVPNRTPNPTPAPRPVNNIEPAVSKQVTPEQDSIDESIEQFNTGLVEDTVQQNREKGKKKKQTKEKKVKTPEEKAKQKKMLIIIGVAIAVIAVGACIIKVILTNSSKHITTVNDKQQQEADLKQVANTEAANEQQSGQSDENQDNETNMQTEAEPEQSNEENVDARLHKPLSIPTTESSTAIKTSGNKTFKVGEWGYIGTVVNTKMTNDEAFIDHESQFYVSLNKVVSGYDNVAELINEYNKGNSENKKITLPDKDSYYKQSSGSELVMFNVEVYYPDDYPTSASEGEVYTLPTVALSLYGTTEEIENDDLTETPEHYIVIDKDIYNISKITEMKNVPETITIGHALSFNFVTSVPAGANKDNYRVDIVLTNGNNEYNVSYEGATIESSGYKPDTVADEEETSTTEETSASEETTTAESGEI